MLVATIVPPSYNKLQMPPRSLPQKAPVALWLVLLWYNLYDLARDEQLSRLSTKFRRVIDVTARNRDTPARRISLHTETFHISTNRTKPAQGRQ